MLLNPPSCYRALLCHHNCRHQEYSTGRPIFYATHNVIIRDVALLGGSSGTIHAESPCLSRHEHTSSPDQHLQDPHRPRLENAPQIFSYPGSGPHKPREQNGCPKSQSAMLQGCLFLWNPGTGAQNEPTCQKVPRWRAECGVRRRGGKSSVAMVAVMGSRHGRCDMVSGLRVVIRPRLRRHSRQGTKIESKERT